mmetsp:Transcript_18955/g.41043  ORF Transcript_18955/g.41043 Transcript_18955/m.41043 type:complete len:231 (-) Transcript_18955:511-1203(-)
MGNITQILIVQRRKDNDFVNSIEKLWLHFLLELFLDNFRECSVLLCRSHVCRATICLFIYCILAHDILLKRSGAVVTYSSLLLLSKFATTSVSIHQTLQFLLSNQFQYLSASHIGSHDKNDILKVNRPSFSISQDTIFHYLQQHIQHIPVRLLNLIQQYDRMRSSPDRLCQLPSFFISHIPRRRSRQPRRSMLLHIFRHVNPYHILLASIILRRQRLGQPCLTHAGRSAE